MTNASTPRRPYHDINVLVYHHQPASAPVIENGIALLHTDDLATILTAHPELKLTHKVIPVGTRHIKIIQSDLWSEDGEKEANKHLPNAGAILADVKIPWRVWIRSLALRGTGELVILSQRVGGQI